MAKKIKKTSSKKAVSGLVGKELKEEVEGIKKTKIRVIGIGGGGGNIVSEIASKISKASFVAANTDSKSLRGCSRKVIKFQFGQNLTHGLGTGMNVELGREAAQNEKDRIKKLLENQDLCILVASLGGGTGSGAVSTFAKISKNLGNLTYGIFTLPFKFEGEKKMEIAIDSLKRVKNHLNALTIIPNERVFQIINKDTPLKEALSVINKFLSQGLEGLIETIYEPGLINIDFADFKTILEGRGRLTYLNIVETPRKEGAIRDLTTGVLNSPLYPYTIRGARGVLFNIAGEKELSLSDVNQISKTISELVNPEAKIIFGISHNKKYSHIIKTVLLATGCGMKISSSKTKLPKGAKVKKRTKFSLAPKKKKINKTKPKMVEKSSFVGVAEGKEEKIERAEAKRKLEPQKAKIKVVKKLKAKSKEKEELPSETETAPEKTASSGDNNEERIRKNALQIRKEAEEIERAIVEKEKIWETPAFLRKKIEKG